ncbi:MAG: thiol:disulfide interchange protein DsbD [Psychrosphaera sp.]|jgi:thiol:disulfide interchange protein DsbD
MALKNILSAPFILIAVLLLSTAAHSSGFPNLSNITDDTFLTAEQAFIPTTLRTANSIQVTIEIAEHYYLYKNKLLVRFNNLDSTNIEYPKGELHTDEYFGEQEIYRNNLSFKIPLTGVQQNASLQLAYQGCAESGLCYPPQFLKIDINEQVFNSSSALANDNKSAINDSVLAADKEFSFSDFKLNELLENENIFFILLMFFLLGLGLSFTPCVFPMYPILTGIIVGQGDTLSVKRAFLLSLSYVQGMAITYTALGIIVAFAGMQFQAAFQHPAVLIGLSLLFIFLALSMFGIFNLALPSKWQQKLNSLSNNQKGGSYLGVLMMGVISGLVASPCTTAPLTAALIYIAQSGDVVVGASALYALSMGMGLPLIILGSSGGKLLPKAGAWMNIIKNIFGFLLLAVPILLLDRILPTLYSELLMITLTLTFSAYLYVINLDSQRSFWFGARSLLIFILMFVGLNQGYQLVMPSNGSAVSTKQQRHHFTKVASLAELQLKIEQAANHQQAVIVDLYADWCIACKEFEKYTFNDPAVQSATSNEVLLQIDLTDTASDQSREVMEHFNVLGLPTILLFDHSGKELTADRITGFLGADKFTAHINNAFN